MSEPLQELQFTQEEIDHAVSAFWTSINQGDRGDETVRAVLRAVRAIPARCLNGSLAGQPAAQGALVQGSGLGGAPVRGHVVVSYPVTTTVHTPDGRTDYLWTNTIRSWDPGTDALARELKDYGTVTGRVMGTLNGKVWLQGETDAYLRADDDGMAVEADR